MELKHFIFGICEIKGLKFIGISLYHLCLGMISAIFRLTPEIRSLYLAGSMASGDIVPGLSDIDIIVVISDMSPEKEYRFLRGLEGKLRYIMPPFGKDKIGSHVFIYSTKEWSLLGDLSAGKKFGPPRKIFEKDNLVFTRLYDKQIKGLQHFYRAAWRLETVQDELSSPVNSTFDLRIRQRTVERCLQSILYGLNEIHTDTAPSPRFMQLSNRIIRLQDNSRRLDKIASINSLLPHIMHIFDIAITYSFHPSPTDKELPDASNNEETELRIKTAKRQASELFCNIFGDSPGGAGNSHELMICTKTHDYFVYDLKDYEITENLIKYYAVYKKRRLRIMSPNYLKQLYLNFPTVSYTFIKLPETKASIMKGRLDYARLVLDTYSLFPQLRATVKRKSPESYKSLSNWAFDLISAWDTERNMTASDVRVLKGSNTKITETGADEEHEFNRFRKLNLMSLTLTNILYERFQSQSETYPGQYNS